MSDSSECIAAVFIVLHVQLYMYSRLMMIETEWGSMPASCQPPLVRSIPNCLRADQDQGERTAAAASAPVAP